MHRHSFDAGRGWSAKIQIWTSKFFFAFLILSNLVTKRKSILYARSISLAASIECMLQVMGNYLSITGDTAGVVVSGAGVTGQCFQDYFWLAPACRQQASSCFLWFTGGNGWGMFEMLVKATTYNMPLATAVASSFSNYGKLPLAYDMMLYWWVPDPTFLRPWLPKLD